MKHILVVLSCLLASIPFKCHSQFQGLFPDNTATHIAVSNGDWNNPSTWSSNSVPGLASIVVIPNGISINYNVNSDAHVFAIRNDGEFSITAPSGTTRKLIVDSFMGGSASFLNIDASAANSGNVIIELKAFDIESKKSGNIGGSNWNQEARNHYSDGAPVENHRGNTFPSDGPGVIGRYNWDPRQATIAIMTWGKVRMLGQDKLDFSECSRNISSGQRSIQLKENPDQWEVGDDIVLVGTGKKQNETFEITAISGQTITVNRNIRHNHNGVTLDGEQFYTYVGNLTRNVVIRSAQSSAGIGLITQRGHTMFMFNGDSDIQNIQFKDLGRSDKANLLDDLKLGNAVVTGSGNDTRVDFPNFMNVPEPDPSKIENQRGRYAFHFHKSLRGQNNEQLIIAKGNVVWGSPGWGMVHHDSHADFTDNLVYEVKGGGMVAESGSETGIWRHNLVTGTEPDRESANTINVSAQVRRKMRELVDDDFRGNAGFGLQGRAVEMVGNVAGGVSVAYHYQGSGIEVITADEVSTSVFEANGKVNPFPYVETVDRTAAPLIRFDGNVAFNCDDGFKSQGRVTGAFHRVLSVISDMRVWNSRRFSVYISSNFGYLITGSKFHAQTNSPRQVKSVLSHSKTDNVNFNDVNFYNFKEGVSVANSSSSGTGNHANARFVYNNVQWKDNASSFDPFENAVGQEVVRNLTPDPNYIVSFQNAGNIDDEVDLNGDYRFIIRGTVTDQAGTHAFPSYHNKNNPILQRVYDFNSEDGLVNTFLLGKTLKTDSRGDYVEHIEHMSNRITGINTPVVIKIYVRNYTPAQNVDTVNCDNLPSTMESYTSITVSVPYEASQNRDVVLQLRNSSNNVVAEGTTTVSAGSGNANIVLNFSTAPPTGTYSWTASIRPVNGGVATDIYLCNAIAVTVTESLPCTPGAPCDDSNSCTINDVYDANCNCVGQSNSNASIELVAVDDAYVQGNGGANNDVLRVDNGNRISYMKFDLSNVSGNIQSSSLELFVHADSGNGDFDIHYSPDVSWTEANLNSSNAPVATTLLQTFSGNLPIGNNVSASLNLQGLADEFTLIISQNSGNDVAFASSENGNSNIRPHLFLELDPCIPNPDPCEAIIMETNGQMINDNQSASQYIQTSGRVLTGYDIEYKAGDFIELLSLFEVESGAVFHAYIENCQ